MPTRSVPLESPALRWKAAALMGLVSSTFSTLVSQLAATQFGREASVDWMTVANIPMRDPALSAAPNWSVEAVGILFHQSADFAWALVFFGVLGRWTGRLTPLQILAIMPFWAVFTSAMEWLFLVPLLPFWQPVFPLEQPYWIGFLAHLSSSLMDPLFPWIRDHLSGRERSRHDGFARLWSGGALALIVGLGALAAANQEGIGVPWNGKDMQSDAAFVRRMTAHHEQGVELAMMAADSAQDAHLRALAGLMAAEQASEIRILKQWWRIWFDIPFEICSPSERANMPGILTPAQLQTVRASKGADFDRRFVAAMSFHHSGAVRMADDEVRSEGDTQLRIMAEAIRHSQQGEIELMRGSQGAPVVRDAVLDMFEARIGLLPAPPP